MERIKEQLQKEEKNLVNYEKLSNEEKEEFLSFCYDIYSHSRDFSGVFFTVFRLLGNENLRKKDSNGTSLFDNLRKLKNDPAILSVKDKYFFNEIIYNINNPEEVSLQEDTFSPEEFRAISSNPSEYVRLVLNSVKQSNLNLESEKFNN